MTETLTQRQRHKHIKPKTKTHEGKDITTNAWTSAAGQRRKDGPPLEVFWKLCSKSFLQEIYFSYWHISVGHRTHYLFETEVITNILLPPIKVRVGMQEVLFGLKFWDGGNPICSKAFRDEMGLFLLLDWRFSNRPDGVLCIIDILPPRTDLECWKFYPSPKKITWAVLVTFVTNSTSGLLVYREGISKEVHIGSIAFFRFFCAIFCLSDLLLILMFFLPISTKIDHFKIVFAWLNLNFKL